MDLVINSAAAAKSSRGVQRYLECVMKHLHWPTIPERLTSFGPGLAGRTQEILYKGRPGTILWTPCQRGSLRAQHHVITVHDCINIEYVHKDDWRLALYLRVMQFAYRRAETVVAISNATRSALLRNFELDPSKVEVIQSGMAPMVAELDTTAKCLEPFALMVTNALPHKNTLAACEAFAASRAGSTGLALQVVGTLSEESRAACLRSGVRLIVEQGVDDAQLARLYRECQFLLAPSLAEGHDLPVAEALAQGAEVLCSDIDVHREFYDGQVRFFDPHRVESMASAIDDALAAPRPWFPMSARAPQRTFVDVARAYEALFHRIEARHA
jgi:glycosyltransferase involved in cell wall biosynthesis